MKKYLRLYNEILKINIALLMAYRANFISHLVVTAVWTCLTIFTMLIITAKATNVYGWSQADMLLLTGGFTVLVGIFTFFFKRSFQKLPETILYGELDGILLKPVDSQFFISTLYMSITSILRSLVGVGFMLYVIIKFHVGVTLISIMGFSLFVVAGICIYYSIWLLMGTLLIWFPQLDNILEVINSLYGTSRYPPEIFREFNFFLFLFLLPFMFVLATPVRLLMQRATMYDVFGSLICTISLLFLSRKFWHFALRHYTSASS